MNWIRSNPCPVALALVIGLAIAALVAPDRVPPLQISVDQNGPTILLEWAPVYGAVFYEIQDRHLGGDFETFAIVPAAKTGTAIPPGAAEFRVRAWTIDGPRAWSNPTGWIFFVPQPPAENSDGRNQEAWIFR